MAALQPVKVVAGDIGGTKTLIQLSAFDVTVPSPRGEVLFEQRFDSRAYPDLKSILREFMARAPVATGELYAACLGVAGPVEDQGGYQHARLTNLPWSPDSRAVAEVLATPRVLLINDFQAIGYGIDAMTPDDLVSLQAGSEQARSPCLVLGAGTGLGVGLRFWDADHYESYPTEGGHIHFAPTDEEQDRLLHFLRAEYGRVSCERLVSGPGLVNIYRFLGRSAGTGADDRVLGAADPAAAITGAAEQGERLASRALELFITIYGSVAGDLALTCLARGGVYIAGGIAPKILTRLQGGRFIDAFRDKGRMRPLTEAMSVKVVVNDRVGLLGTALAASRL